MMETTLEKLDEAVPIVSKYSRQSFDFGKVKIRGTVGTKTIPFMPMIVKEGTAMHKPFQQNDLLQSEIAKLYEIPRASKVTQIIAEEEKYYKNTFNGEVSSAAKIALNHVAAKVAEVNFKKITVEFTLLNTVIFRLELKDNTTLFITVPLTEHRDLDRVEVVYNLFIEGEEIVSNSKNLPEVLEGAKELIRQRVGFTTA